MQFWASSESHQPAGAALEKLRKVIEPMLNNQLASSSLVDLHCMLRYVPIVMPTSMHSRYADRSELRKKEKLYLSAPQLDYETFVSGTYESQIIEYLRGIEVALPYLVDLGASRKQIDDFRMILEKVAKKILADQRDQTRH